ncbi:MAG TPA: hypothetical protein VFN68_12815 [Acidimicrobiales bacterium]|nr:hypothetical protein [Acidimicrobiales bacterium]
MPDRSESDEQLKRTTDPAGFVYGVLVIATVVAAESTRRETFPKLLAASAVTVVLYWLAHAYSHHLGSRLTEARRWSLGEFRAALVHEVTILAGAVVPTVALVAAWIAGASTETGVTSELWTAGVELVALEVVVGIRSRLGAVDVLVQTAIGVGLGVGILAIRVLLH